MSSRTNAKRSIKINANFASSDEIRSRDTLVEGKVEECPNSSRRNRRENLTRFKNAKRPALIRKNEICLPSEGYITRYYTRLPHLFFSFLFWLLLLFIYLFIFYDTFSSFPRDENSPRSRMFRRLAKNETKARDLMRFACGASFSVSSLRS